ncbi:MAG TPA: 16S rRNA (guanine(966)-N(2))-methyltransferase RsmD [Candidatus Dormibacteraeota bacterium]|nr:16S rRNA (guanine(966)-N(2))-methyltransferase RsmD [Candidatus Dormibacteraeota bacterium]
MTIIGGSLSGQTIKSPHNNSTHPMSQKIRGALFNILGDIEGLTILDAFAGSGALGCEAISRGAQSALAIESDKSAQTAIASNIKTLAITNKLKLVRANIDSWLKATNQNFDLVLADPPYNNTQPKLLDMLCLRAKSGGMVVLSLPPMSQYSPPDGFELQRQKSYGDASLAFWRRS